MTRKQFLINRDNSLLQFPVRNESAGLYSAAHPLLVPKELMQESPGRASGSGLSRFCARHAARPASHRPHRAPRHPNRQRKTRDPRIKHIAAINNSSRLPLIQSRPKIQINYALVSQIIFKIFQSIDKKAIPASNRQIDHSSYKTPRPARVSGRSTHLQSSQKTAFRLQFTHITQIYTNPRMITVTIHFK